MNEYREYQNDFSSRIISKELLMTLEMVPIGCLSMMGTRQDTTRFITV